MKIFIQIACFLWFANCSAQKSGFNKFINEFKILEFPFTVNGQPELINKDLFSKKITRFEFLKYLNDLNEPIKKDSYFYIGGKAKFLNYTILIYRITDFGETEALDNIRIVMVVFDKSGKMISKKTIGGMEPEENYINCHLNNDMTITITRLNANNEIQNVKKYFVNIKGEIQTSN
ncbi:MAG: hypothetical protein V4629_05465 [Pseudomonadota bacterium]